MDSLNPDILLEHQKGQTYTQEELDIIYDLVYNKKMTPLQIEKQYGCGRVGIFDRIKNNNWTAHNKRKHKLSSEELIQIQEMVNQQQPIEVIAKQFQVHPHTIYQKIKSNGWDYNILGVGKNTPYHFNEHYFDIIDNEHKAYWCGFLAADGYIIQHKNGWQDQFGLTLQSQDKYMLEQLNNDLEGNHPIYDKEVHNCNKIFYNSTLVYTSNIAVSALIDKGIVARKSLILQYLKDIPKDLQQHMIRGYLDGDGSLGINKRGEYWCQFLGTHSFLSGIQHYLQTNNTIYKRGNIYLLSYYGNRNVPKILNQLYKNASIYLKRKYQKYAEMQGALY